MQSAFAYLSEFPHEFKLRALRKCEFYHTKNTRSETEDKSLTLKQPVIYSGYNTISR
jgi:hypothetical protein